jgi:DUF4097 and DUF4098 domain-containing protein YvlB
VVAAVALIAAALAPCRVGAQVTPVHRGWPAAPTSAVKVFAVSGTLVIEGWDRDSVDLSGVVVRGESAFGGGSLTGIKLGIEGRAQPGVPAGARSQVRVRAPRRALLVARTGAAAIAITGMTETVDAGSAAGDVDVSGALRGVTLETISGGIRARISAPMLRARSTTGRIDVVGEIAEVSLRNVSGTIELASRLLRRSRIETVDGNVQVTGLQAGDGSLDIETFGGSVRLTLPESQHAALDLRSSASDISGVVRVRRGSTAIRQDLSSVIGRVGAARQARLVIGAGAGSAPPITVRTFRGSIAVRMGEQ